MCNVIGYINASFQGPANIITSKAVVFRLSKDFGGSFATQKARGETPLMLRSDTGTSTSRLWLQVCTMHDATSELVECT